MSRKMLAMVCACLIATPASAHWQFTTWGMTAEQVIAASNGSAHVGSGATSAQGDAKLGAAGTYVSGEYQFTVNYWFGSAGLSMVSLSLRSDPQCRALQRDLLAKYGEPVEISPSGMRRMWADQANGNRVVLISTSGFCELQYAPLISAAGAGL